MIPRDYYSLISGAYLTSRDAAFHLALVRSLFRNFHVNTPILPVAQMTVDFVYKAKGKPIQA